MRFLETLIGKSSSKDMKLKNMFPKHPDKLCSYHTFFGGCGQVEGWWRNRMGGKKWRNTILQVQ